MTSAAGDGPIGAEHKSLIPQNGVDTIPHSTEEIEEKERESGNGLPRLLSMEHMANEEIEEANTSFSSTYGKIKQAQPANENDASSSSVPAIVVLDSPSSRNSSLSIPDDTPSVPGSYRSGTSGVATPIGDSLRSHLSPSPRPSFDRRFHAKTTSVSSLPSRANSPAFLNVHSRQSSHLSQLTVQSIEGENETDETEEEHAWEIVRWTKLRKISGQAFSEIGKRTFGRPTYVTVAAYIAVGTSKGLIILFDYQQNLKTIIGQGTSAAEAGSVSSLAISADHSTIASGHANGSIFTWEISKPIRPFLQIPSQSMSQIQSHKHDGHVLDCAVLHVGFLGQRHTALVSADDCGMAFSHLATRGLGAVGRTVKSVRILGRYPDIVKSSPQARKPSSVLAFSPAPLGNVERSTDTIGLTALLTPFLLVIVSTTPVAQTQYKLPRSKQVAAHSAMTGCLAWFPAIKLKDVSSENDTSSSNTKLVYCWSNMLSVLEIDEDGGNILAVEENRPPVLNFRHRSHWECDEAILAVQWLSRSIIALLTVTQRLIILEDLTMKVANSSDLNPKHIYHADLFSRQLQSLVDKVEEDENSMHGVIPDAYHMSFKTYKGRVFLLGMSEIFMGTLLNWADRLMSLVEAGKHIAAIELATSYYSGEVHGVTIGLPDMSNARQALVKDRLLELLPASLRYLLNDEEHDDYRDLKADLQRFATAAFAACVSMDETSFLFDEMYEAYSDTSMPDVFLYTLEPYIIDGKIDIVPPPIFKDLTNWYASLDLGDRLEQIICSLQPFTMDTDQVTGICKQLRLYDGLIYVWTQGLHDWITPLIELIFLANRFNQVVSEKDHNDGEDFRSALKIFPYMAYTLTGRQYPSESDLDPINAVRAKASMYGFLFADKTVKWPRSRGKLISTRSKNAPEPLFPYLNVILHFDAASFMSVLNEVFEDPYLNGGQDQMVNGLTATEIREEYLDVSVNRQRIVNILLEVMSTPQFVIDEKIYLNIFIARNLPKFSQFILLPGSTLRQTLIELCNYPQPDLSTECQLSVEYLLSIYHPPDMQEIIGLLHAAGFYRVLKSIYRGDRQYARWLETFFEDPDDRETVFSCVSNCLRPSAGLTRKQLGEVKEVLVKHGKELATINARAAASTINGFAPDILEGVFNTLDEGSQVQYIFLGAILEPKDQEQVVLPTDDKFIDTKRDRYVELMCQHEPARVADYVSLLNSGDLHLDRVLSAMEMSGVIDAAVTLLAQGGLVRDGMDRLVRHLTTLKIALIGLLDSSTDNPNIPSSQEAVSDLLVDIDKYIKLGIWLCQTQTRTQTQTQNTQPPTMLLAKRKDKPNDMVEGDLTTEEILWLDLTDIVVIISRAVSAVTSSSASTTNDFNSHMINKAIDTLRLTVQSTFTALLATTSSVTARPSPLISRHTGGAALPVPKTNDHRFLHILRAFLTRTSLTSPTLSDLRKVLSTIFSAYAFEESMMNLANGFLDKDVFAHMEEAQHLRRRGWKPKSQLCEVCKCKAWGPGVGEAAWKMWKMMDERKKQEKKQRWVIGAGDEPGSSIKGKGKAVGGGQFLNTTPDPITTAEAAAPSPMPAPPENLVVFSCSHTFHQRCLEVAMGDAGLVVESQSATRRSQVYKCPLCSG